jgi:hypothetical protein
MKPPNLVWAFLPDGSSHRGCVLGPTNRRDHYLVEFLVETKNSGDAVLALECKYVDGRMVPVERNGGPQRVWWRSGHVLCPRCVPKHWRKHYEVPTDGHQPRPGDEDYRPVTQLEGMSYFCQDSYVYQECPDLTEIVCDECQKLLSVKADPKIT